MSIDFSHLKPYKEREFFPQGIQWDSTESLSACYNTLLQKEITTDEMAIDWHRACRELESMIDEEYMIRYIHSTCDTKDKKIADRFKFFIEKINPIYTEKDQALTEKLLSNVFLKERSRKESPLLLKKLETNTSIYSSKNIPLFTKIENLSQKNNELRSSLTVDWEGSTITLQKLALEQNSLDRNRREKAYKLNTQKQLEVKPVLDAIFDEMLIERRQVAKNAGFDNYRDYMFQSKHRYDYTPSDCTNLYSGVKEYVLPLLEKLYEERKEKLNLSSLRSWDLSVDITREAFHSPFANVEELKKKTYTLFQDVDEELASFYKVLHDRKLFDLENRVGKAPGGYQAFLLESRLPFIFMNAVGAHRDVTTLIHESGHSFHSFLAREQDPFQIRAPMEYSEVASMSMELMSLSSLKKAFDPKAVGQLIRQTLLAIPNLLIQVAKIDAFQHWLYTHEEGGDAVCRDKKWKELGDAYRPSILDITGEEEYQSTSWQRIPHIFTVPFYYIEYGIAQIGALQFLRKYKEDPKEALKDYKSSLAVGGTLGLKDLFRRGRLDWSLEEPVIAAAVDVLDREISKSS